MPKHLLIADKKPLAFSLETATGPVSVLVQRSRRRTWQLSIDREGQVTFRIPLSAPEERMQSLLKAKAGWIVRTRMRIMRRAPAGGRTGFRDGASFFVFGSSRTLHVKKGDGDWPKFYEQPDSWTAFVPEKYDETEARNAVSQALELWFRRAAEDYLPSRLDLWSEKMGLARPRLMLKRHKWLWGSCNKYRRTINLNWKIISFPVEVIDYVIIHELCHLLVANHSKRFWGEVVRWCPQWRKLRLWLREESYRHVMPA